MDPMRLGAPRSLPGRWPRTSAAGDVTSSRPCPRMPARGRGSCRKRRESSSARRWWPRRCASAGSRTSRTSSSRDSGARRCRPRSFSPAGSARALLVAERTALNFLGHLSGIATLTARFVEAVAGTGARILDTRKTTPGLRALEKAAVAAGGGRNHRIGLYDAILIKENHIALAGGVAKAIYGARTRAPRPRGRGRGAATSTRSPTRSGPGPTACCSTTWTPRPCAPRWSCATSTRSAGGPLAGGLGRGQPGDGASDRRDRRRLHLDRRPHPLSPLSRLQPPARAGLGAPESAARRGRTAGKAVSAESFPST